MTRWFAIAALLGACGGGARPAPVPAPPLPESPAGIERSVIAAELATLRDIADHACACADAACVGEVDDELAAFQRVATLNDPITDVETWPADLDAMGHAALFRMVACMLDHGHVPEAFGIGELRRRAMIRDAACACVDAPCATRVRGAHDDALKDAAASPLPIDQATRADLDATSDEIRVCLGGLLIEQAILDLKALRAEACACVDLACGEDVRTRVLEWGEDNARTSSAPLDEELLLEIGDELRVCLEAIPAPVQ